jgi:Holliday junction DNA helicase RuvA
MIGRLRGTVVERGVDHVVIDCGGVGYEVTTTLGTLAELPGEGEVTLRIFTHAQENKIALYGFATQEEREVFDFLITVKNVGPSTAVGILSGSPSVLSLVQAIAAGDAAGLTRIKGVGKKTADLLVVELREKCEWLLANWRAAGLGTPLGTAPIPPSGRGRRSPLLDDVASALVGLGWRAAEVDKMVARLEVPADATVETLLRDALRAMPRS